MLPESWRTARKAAVGVELRHNEIVPQGGGGIFGLPVSDTTADRAKREAMRKGVGVPYENTVVTGKRVDTSGKPDGDRSVEQYAASVMHELGHAAWFGNDISATQKATWKSHHDRELERYYNGAYDVHTSIRSYRDDPAHSFVSAFNEYVLNPTAMRERNPRDYEVMKRIVGKEYTKKEGEW